MSAKWVRAKQWDDRHLTGWLLPVKWVLRVLSGIPLAVVLLLLVTLYGILASIPIGILAMAPTWAFYGLTVLVAAGLVGVLPTWGMVRAMNARGMGLGVRWVTGVLGVIGLTVLGVWLWYLTIWPMLRYDPVKGTGVEFFSAFVERYKSVQLRRLPGVEMSELEFYAWWPISAILLLFVLNLIVATVRRIEFNLPRVGVLMVHTGIVTIAMGSVYYTTHKQEGDMLLMSGGVDEKGEPILGRPETGFYDNTAVALWVTQDVKQGWEQRKLYGVPRYNDYNLQAVPGAEMPDWGKGEGGVHEHRDYGALSIDVPDGPKASGGQGAVDADVSFRVIGYMSFGELEQKWVSAEKVSAGASGGSGGVGVGRSLREVEAILDMTLPDGSTPPRKVWRFVPEIPAERADALDLLSIEYARGMSEQRWTDLASVLPSGTRHGLVIEVPGKNFKAAYPVEEGQEIAVGQTGYKVKVQKLHETPPFPIITKGYEGATSSVAVVRILPPGEGGASGDDKGGFDRWVYHRFPEISQDMLQEMNERGMPKRRDASADIRVAYIDASKLQTYFDEREDGTVRALVRLPGGQATVTASVPKDGSVQVAPKLALKLGARAEKVVRVEVPRVTPPEMREKDRIGNHKAAAIAVEVKEKGAVRGVYWLPFTQYLTAGQETERTAELSDGRRVTMAFGRIRHEFTPAMSLALKDFEMIPYPHSETPRDYKSDVVVSSRWNGVYKDDLQKTSLNEPLLVRTPFVKRDDVPAIVNALGWGMSLIAPNQYKFSQAGWDAGGWRESQQLVSSGEAKRPSARFTILGVGNNPGIYIIAAGAVMMSVGIPWAFYLKPWLIQRQKKKLQEAVARGEFAGRGNAKNGQAGGTRDVERTEPVKVGAET